MSSSSTQNSDGYWNDYDPTDSRNNQYDKLVAAITNAVAALPAGDVLRVQGVLWMQGESDSGSPSVANAYEANLTEFIAELRTSLAGIATASGGRLIPAATWNETRFFVGKIGAGGGHVNTVRAAMDAVAAADSNVWTVEAQNGMTFMTNDDWSAEDIHYDTAGQVLLGERFYTTALTAMIGEMVDHATPAGAMPLSGGTGWTLDFSDEFTGTSLDTTKWGIDVSANSRAPRVDRGIDDWWWVSDNVSLDGSGNLVLDVVKHDANTMHCGSISSDGKYEPTYGYFEARIKIADTSKDTHTAFWLQGANQGNVDGTGNDGAEVDIFESAWTGDYTKAVVHIDGYGAQKQASTKQYSTPGLHSGYHTFGMEWTADYMKIYYDGVLKTTYTGIWVPRVPEWLWLSCGASFGDIGSFQSEANGLLTSACVDYVRVWRHPPDTTGPTIDSLSPANSTSGVLASSDLVITFDESVVADTGLITIKNLTDSTQSTINITDSSQVSIEYLQLTIDPTDDLLPGKEYAIQIAPTALDDLEGNSFAGITDDTTWNFTIASSTQPLVLVGGAVLNGNFNANSGTTVTFSSTSVWHNTKGEQGQVATRDDETYDGSQNATLAATRGFGVDTGYTIVEGHDYDISYVWRDSYQWVDGSGQVTVYLFVTDDDTITGVRTNLASHSSGTSVANNSYQAVDQDALYTATASDAGKILFAAIETTAPGFARIDNFELIANPPSLFETWMDGFSVGAQTGPDDDPDGDAVANFLEFAFGMDPSASDGAHLMINGTVNGIPSVVTSDGGTSFNLYFVRRDDHGQSGSLHYFPEFSTNMESFSPDSTGLTMEEDSSDDTNYHVVRVPFPASARFGRVRVQAAP